MQVYLVMLRGVREHGTADDIEDIYIDKELAEQEAAYLTLCGLSVDVEEYTVKE